MGGSAQRGSRGGPGAGTIPWPSPAAPNLCQSNLPSRRTQLRLALAKPLTSSASVPDFLTGRHFSNSGASSGTSDEEARQRIREGTIMAAEDSSVSLVVHRSLPRWIRLTSGHSPSRSRVSRPGHLEHRHGSPTNIWRTEAQLESNIDYAIAAEDKAAATLRRHFFEDLYTVLVRQAPPRRAMAGEPRRTAGHSRGDLVLREGRGMRRHRPGARFAGPHGHAIRSGPDRLPGRRG